MAEVTRVLLKPRRTVGDATEYHVEFVGEDDKFVRVGAGDGGTAPEVDLDGLVSDERTVNGKSLSEDVTLSGDDIMVEALSQDSVAAVLSELQSKIAALEERVLELETAQTD